MLWHISDLHIYTRLWVCFFFKTFCLCRMDVVKIALMFVNGGNCDDTDKNTFTILWSDLKKKEEQKS